MRQPPELDPRKGNVERHVVDKTPTLASPHAAQPDELLAVLSSSHHGLSRAEAEARLKHYGPNAMPKAKPPGIIKVFIHQFASPLIYVLVAAATFSMLIQEWSDAIFIGVVLLVNAIIGTIQEFSAQRAAALGAIRQTWFSL